MLLELTVKNFAIIESLTMYLGTGLNVLTGETGAGKSIIVDAVNLLLGGRASAEMIRDGQDRAFLEGLFEIPGTPAFASRMEELGIEALEGDPLILTREISRSGRNVCRVNSRTVTLNGFRELGQMLVDLHGQQEQQAFFNLERQQSLLDSFAGPAAVRLRFELGQIYNQLIRVRKEIESLKKNERENIRQIDLLGFQLQEIESAKLVKGEEDELLQQRSRLLNSEKLSAGAETVYQLLFESSGSRPAAYDQISQAFAELRGMAAMDKELESRLENLESAQVMIEETAHQIKRYHERLELDPELLPQIEERLILIRQLRRKYGEGIEEILDYADKVKLELERLKQNDSRQEELLLLEKQLGAKYLDTAGGLTKLRRQAAEFLQQHLTEEFAFLQMPEVQFQVSLQTKERWGAEGMEEVEFLIATNPGETLKPLVKIASGGETSRIMLAIKTVLARVDQTATLIFDEIDAGVGGRALEAVASRLQLVARDRQVICVTHSSQIASRADYHFQIEKSLSAGRNVTRVHKLSEEQRIAEIARMLAGDAITPLTMQHAAEMIDRGKN